MTDDLAARLETQERMFLDAIGALATDVAALQQAVAALQPPTTTATPAVPRAWRDRATTAEWDALTAWVDRLNAEYSLSDVYAVPACWRQHPGLVEELAAVHQAWIAAALGLDAGMITGTGSTGLSVWFTQSLWPCLERLMCSSHRYRTTTCTSLAHDPDSPAAR